MKQLTQNKILVLVVAVLLITNLALMLYFLAVRSNHRTGESPSHPISDYVQKQLGFNAEQAGRFRQLRDEHKEAVAPIVDDMKRIKDSLYDLLQEPQVNDSTANLLINEIGEKQRQWELMTFHHFQKLRSICTNDQLPKFDSLIHRMVTRGLHGHKRTAEMQH